MEKELNTLTSYQVKFGRKSDEFHTQLLNIAILTDTCYKEMFPRIANLMVENSDAIRGKYGIDSKEFHLAMYSLNITMLGKYFEESNYESYSHLASKCLAQLENYLIASSNNKLEFLTILSGLYQLHTPNYKKALVFGEQKYELTKQNYSRDSDQYGYAL
ncbi:hypothetical protein LJC54_10420, partial [Parabacteroides sp. OttesenSCG-928-J18]|nr:hypothetical protein [Parabacteroides sp. OttesenSCG-928-J18]